MDRFYNEDPEKEKPFFGDDDDDEDDDIYDDDLYEAEEETLAFMNPELHMEFSEINSKHHLLDKAVEIAQNNWFWAWKSAKSKMTEIAIIYHGLKIITDDEQPESSEQ